MLKELLPYLGKKSARKRIDEIFSRDMLGAVAVGSSFFKIIEHVLNLVVTQSSTYFYYIILYSALFIAALIAFAAWEKIERKVQDAGDAAKEKKKQMDEKKEDIKEKAKEIKEEDEE